MLLLIVLYIMRWKPEASLVFWNIDEFLPINNAQVLASNWINIEESISENIAYLVFNKRKLKEPERPLLFVSKIIFL